MVSTLKMFSAVCAHLLVVLPFAVASSQDNTDAREGTGPPSDEALYQAWLTLAEADRKDTVDWFIAECDRATHFRSTLERYVLDLHRDNRFDWPAATAEPPIYDTAKHAPADLIPRKFVDTTKKRFARTVEALVGGRRARDLRPAFAYDWAAGTVVTLGRWDDPDRIAFNAARGLSPYTNLVEALVEQRLDAGEVRPEAKAFAHAYSDRSGNAYREITLYEAWSSGTEIEMPDVECLGMLHDLEDDWRSFIAPVPERKQRPLYDRLGVHYGKLRKYRALRTALARTYLSAAPVLPGGYGPSKLRLNGFWELQSSDPKLMAADLPTAKAWGAWFDKRAAQADDDPEVVARSRTRMAGLKESRDWTRRTFQGILKEYGAFDPKPAAPSPAPDDSPPAEGGGRGA
ncbi:MAG: hypothetical protein P8M11_12395 [Planctomycetota bacterium]|nr:hypothetical protein [Planctomycetota bacterium]MDG1985361.1 hypothetical protein [Planctomycetota bacterium]